MQNITIYNSFLKYRDSNGEEKLILIADILTVGIPIDGETGDDLELISENIFDENSQEIKLFL